MGCGWTPPPESVPTYRIDVAASEVTAQGPGANEEVAQIFREKMGAMLHEMVADREAAAAEEGERQPNANGGGEAQQGDGAVMRGWSPRASFLWPSSLSFPRGKETRAPPQL